MQQRFDHSRVEHSQLLDSTSYNCQSTTTTTTSTNKGNDEGRVRFERRVGRSGIFVEWFDNIGGCRKQELGVGKSHVQVIVERIERNVDRNNHNHNNMTATATTTTTYDDHSTTSRVQRPMAVCSKEFAAGRYPGATDAKTEFFENRREIQRPAHVPSPQASDVSLDESLVKAAACEACLEQLSPNATLAGNHRAQRNMGHGSKTLPSN